MKLTMLGTGNARVSACYNTCFVMEDAKRPFTDRYFLVDGGGGNGLMRQLYLAGIPWQEIYTVFVTHRHMDHILGIIWLIRTILMGMADESYKGECVVYGNEEVIRILLECERMMLSPKECGFIGKRLHLITVSDAEAKFILGRKVTFFDIGSRKAKQYGFSMELSSLCGHPDDKRLVCCGDEPCSENGRHYADHAEVLLHEAFCREEQADFFKPYEKHHSTVKDACLLAQELGVKNLVLYHTEDSDLSHRKELYQREGRRFYTGNLFIPADLESMEV